MWNKNYKEVKGVVTSRRANNSVFTELVIDFDRLSEITNNYESFVEKVKKIYEAKTGPLLFRKILVFEDNGIDDITKQPYKCIYVAFDVGEYIKLLGCSVNHQKYPHIHEFGLNKTFVSMMSDCLVVHK